MTAHSGLSNSDVIAICAALIALVTFAVSAYQAYLARHQARLSVRPDLCIETCTDDSNTHLTVHNIGLGPAKLKKIQVFYDGTSYDFFLDNQIDKLIARIPRQSKESIPIVATTLQRNSSIPSGGKETLLRAVVDGESPADLASMFNEMQVVVRFESLYEESFAIDNHTA